MRLLQSDNSADRKITVYQKPSFHFCTYKASSGAKY